MRVEKPESFGKFLVLEIGDAAIRNKQTDAVAPWRYCPEPWQFEQNVRPLKAFLVENSVPVLNLNHLYCRFGIAGVTDISSAQSDSASIPMNFAALYRPVAYTLHSTSVTKIDSRSGSSAAKWT